MFSLSPLRNPEKNQAILHRTEVGFAPLGCVFLSGRVCLCVRVCVSQLQVPATFLEFQNKNKTDSTEEFGT